MSSQCRDQTNVPKRPCTRSCSAYQPKMGFPVFHHQPALPLFDLPSPRPPGVAHELQHRGEHMLPGGTTSIGRVEVDGRRYPSEWFKRITCVVRHNLPYVIGTSHSDSNCIDRRRNTLAVAYSSRYQPCHIHHFRSK